MLKRSRDAYDSPGSSPPSLTSKRPFIRAAPPLSPTAQPTSCIGLNTTPYRSAFSVRAPLGTPLDSPGNPFGLERTLAALQLPQPTGIPKHYVLRFQLVRDMERPSLKRQRGGVYRVVRVPRNYTFRHLHKLILFLFASDAHDKLSPPNPSNDKGKGRAYHYSNTWWQGHKFEVQKRVTMHKYSTQVGVIQHGKTVKKLSSVRERKLLRKLLMPQDADGAAQFEESDAEKEMDSWTWEGEDDLTLAQVWSKGFSADRGIIYVGIRIVDAHKSWLKPHVDPLQRGAGSHHGEHPGGASSEERTEQQPVCATRSRYRRRIYQSCAYLPE
ncbi:hypothetical protein K474DRAFT_672787 [Panus rudis PR-1116 ss-1]|nr:hypothetical protein K474DRAFT_672787 [Panus rudis PR-1116 ss-1]